MQIKQIVDGINKFLFQVFFRRAILRAQREEFKDAVSKMLSPDEIENR